MCTSHTPGANFISPFSYLTRLPWLISVMAAMDGRLQSCMRRMSTGRLFMAAGLRLHLPGAPHARGPSPLFIQNGQSR